MKLKIFTVMLCIAMLALTLISCSLVDNQPTEADKTIRVAKTLSESQPTPTDIEYSLERYNLIKRAYWVNGKREKAMSVPCAVARPLGYVVLMTESGAVVGRFEVDGKVTSLNSYLTPDSEYYEYSSGSSTTYNNWLADVDGSYGSNDDGIFFFTPDGKYIEFSGLYLYSDIPFKIANPVVSIEEAN